MELNMELHNLLNDDKLTEEGNQSDVAYALHLIEPASLLAVGSVLKHGEDKYGLNNWMTISAEQHINHAVGHAYRYLLTYNVTELAQAATRMLFALSISIHGTLEEVHDDLYRTSITEIPYRYDGTNYISLGYDDLLDTSSDDDDDEVIDNEHF